MIYCLCWCVWFGCFGGWWFILYIYYTIPCNKMLPLSCKTRDLSPAWFAGSPTPGCRPSRRRSSHVQQWGVLEASRTAPAHLGASFAGFLCLRPLLNGSCLRTCYSAKTCLQGSGLMRKQEVWMTWLVRTGMQLLRKINKTMDWLSFPGGFCWILDYCIISFQL